MARWIKVYDGLLDWGWHTRPEMVSLFIHLLIRANVKDGYFLGIKVGRGEFVTSRAELSKLTGISEQTIRTCLKHLQETGEIIIKSTKQYTIITICKYEEYQQNPNDSQPTTNQQLTNDQPTTNQRLTTSIEYKNKDNRNNNPSISPLLTSRFMAPTVDDVRAYCQEKGYTDIDAEAFVAFYQSKGWKVGSQPMKDWHAAVVTWVKRHKEQSTKTAKKGNYLPDSFKKYYEK